MIYTMVKLQDVTCKKALPLILAPEHIEALDRYGFPGVYIDDEFTAGIEIEEVLSPEVKSQDLNLAQSLCS